MRKLIIILFSLIISQAYSQHTDYGLWKDYLPYNNVIKIVEANDIMYAATPFSLMSYDKNDNYLKRINKTTVGGLSDVGISDIEFSHATNTLVVAYSNTNIDLIKSNRTINIPDITRKSIIGDKTIYKIYIKNKYAYLACGFGIVVLDIEKEEIKDTYMIGENAEQIQVYDITYFHKDKSFYAATAKGILKADENSNLAYFLNWEKLTNLTQPDAEYNLIKTFGDYLVTNKHLDTWYGDTLLILKDNKWEYLEKANDNPKRNLRVVNNLLIATSQFYVIAYQPEGGRRWTIQKYNPGVLNANDAIVDKENNIWIADREEGLKRMKNETSPAETFTFDGPKTHEVFAMAYENKALWTVRGGRNLSFGNFWRQGLIDSYVDYKWKSLGYKDVSLFDSIRDFSAVAIDPSNTNHAFIASWGFGVVEVENGEFKNLYNTTNSSLRYMPNTNYLRIGGVAFDKNNNLWVTNSSANNLLSVRKPNGEWKSFNMGAAGQGLEVADIYIDENSNKWMMMRTNELIVFNENNTIDNTSDDKSRRLTTAVGNGALPSSRVNTVMEDKLGNLWIGSDVGIHVIYSANNIFSSSNIDAQRVKIVRDGFVYDLLETESVTSIAINGNNEKWIGTAKSGVFLMSEDGTKEILHLTKENSPLLTNTIQGIVVTPRGEVIIATSSGIVSYQDYKVDPYETLDSLSIYPNPVRPGYEGPIFINNLVGDSQITITDVSGNLVWNTENNGGQAIWYGVDLRNRKVASGVYYIYIVNKDMTHKQVGKVLIVR